MKIYSINTNCNWSNEIKVEELEIKKETAKTFVVGCGSNSHTIRKKELPFKWSYGQLITDNLEDGKLEWNRKKTEEIERYKERIKKLEGEFIII